MSELPEGTQGGGSSVDTPSLRALFADGRTWISQAKVTDDAISDNDEGIVDVPVELWPTGIRGFAKVATNYAANGYGEWSEPQKGDLVLVALCQAHEGDNGEWFIIGGIWNKAQKKPSEDAGQNRVTVIRNGKDWNISAKGSGVKIHVSLTSGAEMHVDSGSGAGPITLNSETNDLRLNYTNHTHVVPGIGSTGVPSLPVPDPYPGSTVLLAE